jgi:hypothetical protein
MLKRVLALFRRRREPYTDSFFLVKKPTREQGAGNFMAYVMGQDKGPIETLASITAQLETWYPTIEFQAEGRAVLEQGDEVINIVMTGEHEAVDCLMVEIRTYGKPEVGVDCINRLMTAYGLRCGGFGNSPWIPREP